MFPRARHFSLQSGHWHKPIRVLYTDDYWGRKVEGITSQDQNKIKFGYVRNPWDWYVSFYYHQKKSNGLFYKTYTSKHADDFVTFLSNLLSPVYNGQHKSVVFYPLGDARTAPIALCKLLSSWTYGFFTFCFVYTFFKNSFEIFNKEILLRPDTFSEQLTADDILKTEDLFNELFVFLGRHNIKPEYERCVARLYTNFMIRIKKIRMNKYKRKRPHYSHYYNDSLRELVLQKDCFLIDEYHYLFEQK